jgi:hypothetical protein
MATASSTGTVPDWRLLGDNTIPSGTISNSVFSYVLQVTLNGASGSNIQVGGVRIAYTVTSPLP